MVRSKYGSYPQIRSGIRRYPPVYMPTFIDHWHGHLYRRLVEYAARFLTDDLRRGAVSPNDSACMPRSRKTDPSKARPSGSPQAKTEFPDRNSCITRSTHRSKKGSAGNITVTWLLLPRAHLKTLLPSNPRYISTIVQASSWFG